MKKLLEFIDFLWESEILTALTYIITLGWYACAASIVMSHGGTIGKIFFFVWAIILALIWLTKKATK